MNYNNIPLRATTPKPSYLQPAPPVVLSQKIIPNQYVSPLKQIVPTTEVVRIIPKEPQYYQQQDSNQLNGLSVTELKAFLEDLMKRYDKLALELQKSAQKEIQLQNQVSLLQTELNSKLLQFQQEREGFQQTLNNKNDEINYLNQQINSTKENHYNEMNQLKQENEQIAIVLTDKLDQMNQFAKEKVIELDQAKSLLVLREQEVQEWRNRKNNGDIYSQEINQLKQKIYLLQQEKEQLVDRLRYSQQDSQVGNENQMLRAQLLEKEQELNTMRMKVSQIINQFQYGNQENNQQLLIELEQAKQEILYYQQQLQNGQNPDVEDYEDKIHILENEIRRLNKQLTEIRHELEEQKSHKSDNEFLRSKLSDQQNQLKDKAMNSHLEYQVPKYY